jgi:hypothetical protein
MRHAILSSLLLSLPALAQDLREPLEYDTDGPIIQDGVVEGFWVSSFTGAATLDALAGLAPDARWSQQALDLSRAPAAGVALVFEGILAAPRDGLYTFRVRSPLERRFLLGDVDLGSAGELGLRAGPHRFRVEVLRACADGALAVSWAGPGFDEHELVHEDLQRGRSLRAAGSGWPAQVDPRVGVRKIWEGGHCAFTDLARFGGRLYCCFREGQRHVHGADGKVRVIASQDDGATWESVALLAQEGVDLRDPKLATTPDGRLMLSIGGSVYAQRELVVRAPWVSFSNASGTEFGAPRRALIDERIRSENDWLWRVTWRGDTGYGVVYQPGGLHLARTRDGVEYEHLCSFDLDGRPNETTLRFDAQGRMVALVRREEGDACAYVGKSWPPFENWEWRSTQRRLGGPNFVVLADGTWIGAGRSYHPDGAKTELGPLRLSYGHAAYTPRLQLPSGGDTSYPGMLVEGARLLVSYYSSHEGATSIYLADVPLEVFAGRR